MESLQGFPVDVIVFSFQKGLFKGSRLIYLHGDSVAFNATYLVGKTNYDLLEPVIDYSFESFRVWEPGKEAEDPVFHLDEGVKLAADDEPEAAIEAFSAAIELDPELVEAYTRRASAYRGAGELAKALADSSKAIELRPDDRSLYYDRALTQWYLLDHPQAIADIDHAIQLDPGYYDAYNIRALIQATQGNYEAALASVNQAFSLDDPSNAPLLDTRGYIYIKMEQFDKAKADFEAIFDQDLRFPYALLGAGLAYGGLGETDEAIKLLEEGLAEVEDTESPDPQLADLIRLAEERLADLKKGR
jgi:tetratricopeptide (TPR) repeat protein